MGGQPHVPAASTPEKTRYPLYRKLGGPQGRSGRVESLVPTGIRSRTVQSVAQSLYRLSYRAVVRLLIRTNLFFFLILSSFMLSFPLDEIWADLEFYVA